MADQKRTGFEYSGDELRRLNQFSGHTISGSSGLTVLICLIVVNLGILIFVYLRFFASPAQRQAQEANEATRSPAETERAKEEKKAALLDHFENNKLSMTVETDNFTILDPEKDIEQGERGSDSDTMEEDESMSHDSESDGESDAESDIDEDEKDQMDVEMGDINRSLRLPDQSLVEATCAICLECYQVGDAVVWSDNDSCVHAFHRSCIVECLMSKKENENAGECPCCRQPFVAVS